MTEEISSLERFAELLDAYGARLERWPESEAHAARALLQVSERAKELLAEAASFDQRLDELEILPLSPAFVQRLARIPLGSENTRVIWPFGSLWTPALGWAAAAALGLWLGTHFSEVLNDENGASASDDVELVALTTGAFSDLEDEP